MVKCNIFTGITEEEMAPRIEEIYNKHKVICVKFTTDTNDVYMYYTVMIIYEVSEYDIQ